MKLLTTIIVMVLLTMNLFAMDHVHDKATMLGDKAQTLETQLQGSHVYIETLENNPVNGLEAFSINALNTIGQNDSFLILVVKQSHQWRITMHPTGFVGSALTKSIGDSMVSGFKRGDFYGALADASSSLNRLALNPPVPHVTTTTTTSHQVTRRAIVPATITVYHDDYAFDDSFIWFFLVMAASIAIIFLIWIICKFIYWLFEPQRIVSKRDSERTENTIRNKARIELDPSQRVEAQKVYSSYSPAQRQQIANQCVGSPYYYQGCHNDPYSFMYMMLMMNMMSNHYNGFYQQQYSGYGGGGGYSSPAADTITDTTTTTTTTDNYQSRDTDSDHSGSGGSWDASSSSDRSDSDSGSGGSWGSDSSSSSSDDSGSSSSSSWDSGSSSSSDSSSSSSDSGGGGSW